MQFGWRGLVVFTVLLTSLVTCRRDPCRWCRNVSQVWHGTAYKCGFCPRVPRNLPRMLTWLQLVAFQSDKISSYDFKPYRNLIDLRLSENMISDISTSAFKHLHHLHHLYLSENQLNVFPYVPGTVRVLHIQGNNISRLPLLHLRNLHDFVADFNAIKKIESRTFKHTHNLSLLSLSSNNLEYANFLNVPSLEVVSLERNRLVEFPLLPSGVHAVYLDLNNIQYLPELNTPLLEELHLADNNISEIDNRSFVNTPKLRLVDLTNNPLSERSRALLDSLRAQARVEVSPRSRVIKQTTLTPVDQMENGYVWIVAVVSSFAFLSAIMIAVVVIVLTRAGCDRSEVAAEESTDTSLKVSEALPSDEEKLVVNDT